MCNSIKNTLLITERGIMRKKPIPKHESRELLVKYLSNPNNKPLTRKGLAVEVLGHKNEVGLYNLFSSAELYEIDAEALDIKRTRYSSALSKIDTRLIKEAAGGNVNAIKLAYQRFENWAPSKELKLNADMHVNIDKEDAGCL